MPTKACTRVKPTSSTTREDISSSFPTISEIIAELAQNKNDFRLLQTRFKSVVDDMQILSKNIVSIEDRLNEKLTSEHLQDSSSNLKPELKKSRYVSAPEISLSPNQSDTEESQVTMPNPIYSKVFSPLDQAKCDDHILEFPPNNNDSHHRNVTPHDVLAALGKDDDVSNSNLGNSQVDTSFFINGKIDRQAANIKGKEMSHHTIIAKKKIQINQSMLFPLEIPCNEMIQELQNERLEDMPLSKKHNKDGQSKFSKPSKKKINMTTEGDSASVCAKNHVISNVIGSEVDNASVGFEVVNTDNKGTNKSINKKSRRTYGGDSHLSALQKKKQMQIERIKLMQLLQGN